MSAPVDADDEEEGAAPLPGGLHRYLTPAGLAHMQAELNQLMREERPRIVEIVSWAAGNGDRSENGDYLYGKKRLREIDRRARFLGKRIDKAQVVDPRAQTRRDQVFFGATVVFATEADEERVVTIVGVDEADLAKGEVSLASPVARALMGKRVGDEVRMDAPRGPVFVEITAILRAEGASMQPNPLKVAVQMDPIETVDPDADSTFALMLEAQARGHSLWVYEVRHLSLREGRGDPSAPRLHRLTARARPVSVQRVRGAHARLGEEVLLDLSTMGAVLMRQDPPFDMGYITATHMLEHVHPHTLVVNDPRAVRDAPEKLLVTHFPDLMPPTLVSWDTQAIRDFRTEHKDIIVKPLFGNGGAGVFRIREGDENLGSLLEMFFTRSREPLMIQRYEPAVRAGDKRIILADGEPIGAINRVPAQGEARSNMHIGGVAQKVGLTARDREICRRIGPHLRGNGLIFVGIDVIGDWLTEINVTSPTGLQEIDRFDGVNTAGLLWDRIEAAISGAS